MTEAELPRENYFVSQAKLLTQLRPVAAHKIRCRSPLLAFHLQFDQLQHRAFATSNEKMIAFHLELRRSAALDQFQRPATSADSSRETASTRQAKVESLAIDSGSPAP